MKTGLIPIQVFLLCIPFYIAGQNIIPAEPISPTSLVKDFLCENVIYPEDALDSGKEGKVLLRFIVDDKGKVSEIRIAQSAGEELDEEALRLFRMIEWKPAYRLGSPVTTEQEFEIDFNIKKYNKHCKERGYGSIEYPYKPVDTSNIIYTKTDVDQAPYPSFEYKTMTLSKFMSDNLVYPEQAYQRSLSGTVSLSFVVEPNGRISNIVIEKGVGGGCNEEAIRLIKLVKWMPGIKNKAAVRSRTNIEVNFKLPSESDHKLLDYNMGG